jgi:agmatine deiminase
MTPHPIRAPSPPAEWARHDACWLAWPRDAREWGDALEGCKRAVAALAAAIADVDPQGGLPRGERVELLVGDARAEEEARAALAGVPARLHRVAYGDIWLRDTGPVFVRGGGEAAAAGFRWTGWGGKYLFPDDQGVAAAIAERAGTPLHRSELALEGGGIDSDGEGTLLTTRECLLSQSRNPGHSERDIERELEHTLGARRVIWLDRGLRNDHTDGHVDNLARFVAPGRVACARPAAGDPNRGALDEIARVLEASSDAAGRPLELAPIPSPGAVVDAEGELMPASYLNFYIGNRVVVVPSFGVPADDAAARAIAALFPERRVVSLDARAVLAGGGAFHCITRDQPSEGL